MNIQFQVVVLSSNLGCSYCRERVYQVVSKITVLKEYTVDVRKKQVILKGDVSLSRSDNASKKKTKNGWGAVVPNGAVDVTKESQFKLGTDFSPVGNGGGTNGHLNGGNLGKPDGRGGGTNGHLCLGNLGKPDGRGGGTNGHLCRGNLGKPDGSGGGTNGHLCRGNLGKPDGRGGGTNGHLCRGNLGKPDGRGGGTNGHLCRGNLGKPAGSGGGTKGHLGRPQKFSVLMSSICAETWALSVCAATLALRALPWERVTNKHVKRKKKRRVLKLLLAMADTLC
ncbi:unnamed protein product [Ilex paraguariensis]|uniref:HMA domain-containing protein n=1 Tax=Ilex paraguariensis TaxID=185542 RepID=A0ABC8TUP5_9AQUA